MVKLFAAAIASLFVGADAAIKSTAANAAAQEFLEAYSTEEGATVMPSGLMYKVLKEGKGEKPDVGTPCSCHYEGRTVANYPDGATFDSSIARGSPTTFAPNQVIKAWTEGMQMMPIGSKWELVCPPEIAYGSRAMGAKIPANSVLIFEMEMLSCTGKKSEI
jgi:FKBP-type peptidyl-prolyl cis-trans isomerase FklB|tara:strand:- start:113 stop:598 length:486 start_codon:yes stop_codon:yes gene_type:complete